MISSIRVSSLAPSSRREEEGKDRRPLFREHSQRVCDRHAADAGEAVDVSTSHVDQRRREQEERRQGFGTPGDVRDGLDMNRMHREEHARCRGHSQGHELGEEQHAEAGCRCV
jgi:hypothetical protein